MRHFHSLVKCALSYWLAIVGSSLKKLYHHVIIASLVTTNPVSHFVMVNVWPYYLSGLPLQRYFNDICTQHLCQASVSPLRH